jgi:hypothetical protein
MEPGPASRRRKIAAAILFVVAVATHGPGLFFVGAAAVLVAISPARRNLWVTVAPAVAIFAVWSLIWGDADLAGEVATVIQAPALLVDYVKVGLGSVAGNISGLGPEIGLVIVVILIGATVWHTVRTGEIMVGAAVGCAGLVIEFVVIGLARGSTGSVGAVAPRYVYMSAVFAALALASWLGRVRPLYSRTAYMRATAVVAVVALLPLWTNSASISIWSRFFQDRTYETRATIELLLDYAGTPAIPADTRTLVSSLKGIPSAPVLRELFARYGSPLDDPAVASLEIPDETRQAVFFGLVKDSLVPSDSAALPAEPLPISVKGVGGATLTQEGECIRAVGTSSDPQLALTGIAGTDLYLQGRPGEAIELYVALSDMVYSGTMEWVTLGRSGIARIHIPDLGSVDLPYVRVDPPVTGSLLICAGEPQAAAVP